MSTRYLSYEFINDRDDKMVFIIDPPCVEYIIEPGQKFELRVKEIKLGENNKSPVITFRCENEYTNIDVNYCDSLAVVINGIEDKIW